MKTNFFILNFILCIELLLSPLLPGVTILTSGVASAQSCASGLVWNNTLKRCLVTDNAAQTANQLSQCEARPDDEGKKECYKENAEDKAGGRWASHPLFQKGVSFVHGPVNLAAAYVGVIFAAKAISKSLGTCSMVSYWAMVAGSAALVAGDVLWTYVHGQNLNAIESEWKSIVKPNTGNKDDDRANSIEAQSKSFGMLAKAEESLAETAKWKGLFFAAATAAYATSGVAAGLEMFDPKSICSGGEAEESKTPPAEVAPTPEIISVKNELQWDQDILEYKHYQNLQSAGDLVSFQMLLSARHKQNASPSIEEYEAFQKQTVVLPETSGEVLSFMKMVANQVIININPIAWAQAQTTLPQNPVEGTLLTQDPLANSPLTNNPVMDSPIVQNPIVNKAKEFANDYIEVAFKSIGAAIGAGLAGATLLWANGIAEKMTTPVGRMLIAGGLGGLSGVMAGYNGALYMEATNRAQLLKKLQREFDGGMAAIGWCKSEDRNDPQKPDCYCFTQDNQPNPARTNSQICEHQRQRTNFNSGIYTREDNTNGFCIDSNHLPDPKCACRRSSRKCMKATPPFLGSIDAGNFKMLATGFAPVDQIGEGTFSAGKSRIEDLLNQAINMRKAQAKILKRPEYREIAGRLDQDTKNFQKKLIEIGASHPSNLPVLRPLPASPAAAIATLEKDLGSARDTRGRLSIGSANSSKTGSKHEHPQIELGLTQKEYDERQGQVAELMDQEMDIGVSDISNGEDLFKVLSNRYQKSGMKKLFGDKEAMPPAANR